MSQSPLSNRFWHQIGSRPAHPFWVRPTETRSYDDLAEALLHVTASFTDLDLKPGDRILLASNEDWASFVVWLGAVLNGMVPVLLAGDAGAERIEGVKKRLQPKLLVISKARASEAWVDGIADCSIGIDIDLIENDAPKAPSLVAPEDDLAYILFTSGSTSEPKGVMITHANLHHQLDTVTDAFRVTADTRLFNSLVLYHADGLIQGPVLSAWTGSTVLRADPFHPGRASADMAWLSDQGATHMMAAPTLLEMIERFTTDSHYFDRPEFVAILSSSAALMPSLWDRFEDRFKVKIINEYGMSETVAASHFAGDFPGLGQRHTIGLPLGCEARLVGNAGNEVSKGRRGELVLRGANIFAGYLGDPSRTAEAFEDGWLKTGDLCVELEDGSYSIVGRRATTIKSGGFLILPEEIDEAASRHPAVIDQRTIGVADDFFGEIPVTAYVSDSELAPKDLIAHLRSKLESRKVPKRVIQVEAIPRTGSGKPDLPKLTAIVLPLLTRDVEAADDDVPARITALAADVFGISAAEVSEASTPDNTLGWDSYAHTTLMLEIEDTWGVEIPTNDMMSANSIGDLVELVRRLTGTDEPAMPGVQSGGFRVEEIRDGGDQGSIIAMPAVGGRTNWVLRIMHGFPEGYKMFGLSMSADTFLKMEDVSVPEIADRMTRDILAADLSEPVVLLGFSYGGFLANEVSARLTKAGYRVQGQILIDTAVPERLRANYHQRRLHRLFKQTKRRLGRFVRRRTFSIPIDNKDRFLFVKGVGYFDIESHPERLRDRVYRALKTMEEYVPSTQSLPTLVIAAKWRFKKPLPLEDGLGWKRFNSGEIRMPIIGRKHHSIVEETKTAQKAFNAIRSFLHDTQAKS